MAKKSILSFRFSGRNTSSGQSLLHNFFDFVVKSVKLPKRQVLLYTFVKTTSITILGAIVLFSLDRYLTAFLGGIKLHHNFKSLSGTFFDLIFLLCLVVILLAAALNYVLVFDYQKEDISYNKGLFILKLSRFVLTLLTPLWLVALVFVY